MLFAGLGTASNQFMQEGMSEEARRDLLMEYTDELRLSMAANLQDYHMQSFQVIRCHHVLCTSVYGFWSGLYAVPLPALLVCLSVCPSVCTVARLQLHLHLISFLLGHFYVVKSAHGLHSVLSINQPISLVFCDLPEHVNRPHQAFGVVVRDV